VSRTATPTWRASRPLSDSGRSHTSGSPSATWTWPKENGSRAIEDRGPELDAQINVLRSRIAVADARRAAFVALVGILRGVDQQIVQEAQRLYADVLLITSTDERRTRLESIDRLVRSRARIAAPLAVVSSAREFRRAPDPLGALADDLRARADEIDRQRAPGMRRNLLALPDATQELIAALNGRSQA
jgi:hypothetical protein